MLSTLFEVEHEVDVITGHLEPIAHRKRLWKIGHPFNARDRGLRSLLHRAQAHCAIHAHQPGNDWQDSQKEGSLFHNVSKRWIPGRLRFGGSLRVVRRAISSYYFTAVRSISQR